ncbi:unnamed protein product [Rotaria sp. Silwood2]|nr:unnamed protein product [Rotaria sp. Silwood2]CAF2659890.1 unnamed protein product [Rotaria sp. Silwood2]CAF2895121.1 unnamed protein product [Rotaria sp. Silwood2]CAF3077839.1 unnamed protein product [Rotaria sp. Silwood2]CAF4378476.1 unnamed protein product [Rotaria sp. Silwood2]
MPSSKSEHEHNHNHDHNHDHHSKRLVLRTKTFRLLSMLFLTFGYFVVELVVGNITKSVALIADSFHMLSDVISLVIGLTAVRFVKRGSDVNTYGWVRAEVVGANINTVFLLALCLTIVFDAIKRFVDPEPIENVNLLLIVGSVGLGVNIIGLLLFQGFHGHSHGGHSHGDKNIKSNENIPPEVFYDGSTRFERHSTRALQEVIEECSSQIDEYSNDTVIEMDNKDKDDTKNKPQKKASMNMHGVFLHVLADALGSVVVIISALIIKFVPHNQEDKKHWTVYIDPMLSVIIVIIISISTIPLFRDTSAILLQQIPKNLEIHRIKTKLLEAIPEIRSIHELHVWRLTDEKIIASAHLHRKTLSNYMLVAEKVKDFFHSIGIHSSTMQYECDDDHQTPLLRRNTNSQSKIAGDCLLRCENNACDTQTCCPIKLVRSNALLNTNDNTLQVFSITGPQSNPNPLQTQVSTDTSTESEKL